MSISPEQLLAQIDDLLRTKPINSVRESPEWLGRVAAVLEAWNSTKAIQAHAQIQAITGSITPGPVITGYNSLIVLLNQAKHDLGLKTGQFSLAINQGQYFEYFDEIRQIIETSQKDLLFVDPYLNADFVKRYLPHIKPEVSVRLLGRKRITALASAAEAFSQQEGGKIEVRSSNIHHDRFLIVDKQRAYSSSASFHDGAKKPTLLIEVLDTFDAIQKIYENAWQTATVATATS